DRGRRAAPAVGIRPVDLDAAPPGNRDVRGAPGEVVRAPRHALPPARSLGALRDPRPAPGAVSRLRPAQLRAPRPALGRARLVQERGATRGVGSGAPPRPLGTP